MEDDVDMELELERQMEREQQLDNIKQVQKLVRRKDTGTHSKVTVHNTYTEYHIAKNSFRGVMFGFYKCDSSGTTTTGSEYLS